MTTNCRDPLGYSPPTPATSTLSLDLTQLPDGLLRLCAIAIDGSGLQQGFENAKSYSWLKDTTPPDMSKVLVDDGGYTSHNSESPLVIWNSPIETNGSGLDRYEIFLGNSPSLCNLVNWTDIGLLSFHQFLQQSFEAQQIYYVSLRAFDRVGNQSSTVSSEGFRWRTKTNLQRPEIFWDTYGEGTFEQHGAVFDTSRGGENRSYDGVLLNHRGLFYVSPDSSCDYARISKDSNWLLYLEGRSSLYTNLELWSFNSETGSNYFIDTESASRHFTFNHDETRVYYVKIEATSYGLWIRN